MKPALFILLIITVSTSIRAQTVSADSMQIFSGTDSMYIISGGKESAFAHKDMALVYLHQGIESAAEGRLEEAKQQLRTGLLYDLENADILYNLGLVDYYLEMYDEAIKYFDAAAEYDVENANIYNQRALAKAMLGEYDNAATDFKIMLKYDPDFAMGNYNYGILLLQEDDVDNACDWLHKADALGYENAQNVIEQYCQ